jgi:16S rRNA (guanine(966)-N(2))-methyltransferase RsmD
MVREAVFGMVMASVPNADVLDLFCGSGAYAFEALSRGAACAVLVDSNKKAADIARLNAEALGYADRCEIHCRDYLVMLERLRREERTFDLIFIDPPYGSGFYGPALEACALLINANGRIVAEHAANVKPETVQGLRVSRQRSYGIRAVTILERCDEHDRNLSGEL